MERTIKHLNGARFVDIFKRAALVAIAVVALGLFLSPRVTYASHENNLTTVDNIDGTFAAGGGVLPGTLTGNGDDGYFIFPGAAGDIVTIAMTFPTGDAFLYLFLDNNGTVNPGDIVNIISGCLQGPGATVTFLACDDDEGPGTDSLIASFALLSNGQYLIGASSYNDAFSGEYTITLRGNSASVPAPEPISMLLVGSGLAGLIGYRRRRGQK